MALVANGHLCWSWIGLQLPNPRSVVESPMFYYQGREWFLKCFEGSDGIIRLSLNPKVWPGGPKTFWPFYITVKVQGTGLSQTEHWTSPIVWRRISSEVERLIPEFRLNRLLTFQIHIQEQDPLSGFFVNHCSQPRKNYVDASVQTSLTANSISCLDALSEDFAKMMDADSDMDIHCDGHFKRTHKNVLCSRSPVLARMLQTDMVEGRTGVVNIRGMDADIFQLFIRYLYTGKLDDTLTFDSAMSLYEAGDMYEVISLKTFCSDLLRAKLTFDNACEVLALADAHADSGFSEVSLPIF